MNPKYHCVFPPIGQSSFIAVRNTGKRVQNYLNIFLFFLGNFYCICAFAWSEGTGGREGGTEGGRGWIFPWETLIPSHF